MPMKELFYAGYQQLTVEEGSCIQTPGAGISGRVQGVPVMVGSQEFVYDQLDYRERAAAARFLEASTSQSEGEMQVSQSLILRMMAGHEIIYHCPAFI